MITATAPKTGKANRAVHQRIFNLRQPRPGERCAMDMNHEAMTFTWKSLETGESLKVPETVAMMLKIRGMRQVG